MKQQIGKHQHEQALVAERSRAAANDEESGFIDQIVQDSIPNNLQVLSSSPSSAYSLSSKKNTPILMNFDSECLLYLHKNINIYNTK